MSYLPPVFVNENGDVACYASAEAAAFAMEAIDVRAGEYQVFDAYGMVFEVFSPGDGASDPVLLEPTAEVDTRSLVSALRQFVAVVGEHRFELAQSAGVSSLSELVSAVALFEGYAEGDF